MTQKKLYGLTLLLAALLLQFIFPPWENIFYNGKIRIIKDIGYNFIFSQWGLSSVNSETRINWDILLATLLATITFSGLVFLFNIPYQKETAWRLIVKSFKERRKELLDYRKGIMAIFKDWTSSKEFNSFIAFILIMGPLAFTIISLPAVIKFITPYELLDEIADLFLVIGALCWPAGLFYYWKTLRTFKEKSQKTH